MGIPLPQASLKAATGLSWQEMSQRNTTYWRALPGTGEEKARQIVNWLHQPDVAALAKWLAEQHINGF
jgi:DNA ligase (NAD+)